MLLHWCSWPGLRLSRGNWSRLLLSWGNWPGLLLSWGNWPGLWLSRGNWSGLLLSRGKRPWLWLSRPRRPHHGLTWPHRLLPRSHRPHTRLPWPHRLLSRGHRPHTRLPRAWRPGSTGRWGLTGSLTNCPTGHFDGRLGCSRCGRGCLFCRLGGLCGRGRGRISSTTGKTGKRAKSKRHDLLLCRFFFFSGLVIWNILSSSSVATITTIDLYQGQII